MGPARLASAIQLCPPWSQSSVGVPMHRACSLAWFSSPAHAGDLFLRCGAQPVLLPWRRSTPLCSEPACHPPQSQGNHPCGISLSILERVEYVCFCPSVAPRAILPTHPARPPSGMSEQASLHFPGWVRGSDRPGWNLPLTGKGLCTRLVGVGTRSVRVEPSPTGNRKKASEGTMFLY